MADPSLLSFGFGIFFLATAGVYVGVRERFHGTVAEADISPDSARGDAFRRAARHGLGAAE